MDTAQDAPALEPVEVYTRADMEKTVAELESYWSSYDSGYTAGYAAGRKAGYEAGYKEGRVDGYSDGFEEGFWWVARRRERK